MHTEEPGMDWSIQQIAALTGTTSRTLRHYAAIGLLPPSRIAANGYRHYGQPALVRLQRILLLRELGLGLQSIASVLERQESAVAALQAHAAWLRGEQDRLGRLIVSVEKTIEAEKAGGTIMAKDMFDGFDHTQHKEEVEHRWEQKAWKERLATLGSDWIAASTSGVSADSAVAQDLARRHVAWLRSIPGTPAAGGDVHGYVLGLAEMYVADPRFAANYGGATGASFVRDALTVYAQHSLQG
jgi:DNA-binding transcriptional MerR regulator